MLKSKTKNRFKKKSTGLSILLLVFLLIACTPGSQKLSIPTLVSSVQSDTTFNPAKNNSFSDKPIFKAFSAHENFKIKTVRTTSAGAFRRILDQPSYSVTASLPLQGGLGDTISTGVGNVFNVTAIIHTNTGTVTDLTPITISPSGIVDLLGTTVTPSGTTLTLRKAAPGTATVSFSQAYYGLYFDVFVTGDPTPPGPPQAVVELASPTYNGIENGGTLPIQVSRSGNTLASSTVDMFMSVIPSDTATGGGVDYTSTFIEVNFGPGSTSEIVNIPLIDDALVEGDETISLFITNPGPLGTTIGAQNSAIATIIDDEVSPPPPAIIEFNTAAVNAFETAGNLYITVVRSNNTAAAVQADLTFTDISATGGGVDYDSTTIVVNFAPGVVSQLVAVPITLDVPVEVSESFTMTLTNPFPGLATIGPQSTATGTIMDGNDTITAPISQITFGVPAAPNAVKSLQVLGPAAETTVVNVNPPPIANTLSNLVAWWPAENNANDQTGIHDGLLLSGTTFNPGQIGQAFQLNGSDNCVGVQDHPALQITGQITLSAWIKIDDPNLNDFMRIISKKNQFNDPDGYELEYNPALNTLHLLSSGANLGEALVDLDTNWHHVAGVINGTTATIYVDGQDLTRDSVVDPLAAGTTHLTIGCIGSFGSYFRGQLDDLRIYDRALSPSEIQILMNSTSNTNSTTAIQQTFSVNALDNSGSPVAGVVDFIWSLAPTAPYPGYLRYPAGNGLPSNQADVYSLLTGHGSVQLSAQNITTGLSDDITLQVNEALPEVLDFRIEPPPAVDCVVALPSTTDTNCNVTIAPGTHTFTVTLGDGNGDVLLQAPFDMAYENVFGFSAAEGIAPPGTGHNVYLTGFNGQLASGAATYGTALGNGGRTKTYSTQIQFNADTGGIPGGTLRFRAETGTGQFINHTWNITVNRGLVSEYLAEGNANDSVSANHGVLQNGTGFGGGQVGANSFNFDGVDDFVEVPHNNNLNMPTEVTITAWISSNALPPAGGHFYTIAKKGDTISTVPNNYIMQLLPGSGDIELAYSHSGNINETLSVPTAMIPGVFYHVAGVIDVGNLTMKIYLNGVEISNKPIPNNNMSVNVSPLWIGRQLGSNTFNGRLDNVRIYNYALTTAEIFNQWFVEQ